MMGNLVDLLNSQETLTSLQLYNPSRPFTLLMSSYVETPFDRFAPKFKLEQLLVEVDVEGVSFQGMNRKEHEAIFIRKLLSTCIENCKTLNFDITAPYIKDIVDSLVEMRKLEEFKFDYIIDHNEMDRYCDFNELLKSSVMQCQLKKLEVGRKFLVFHQPDAMRILQTLLTHQKDSLEELTLAEVIPSSCEVWKLLGKMPMLKVLKTREIEEAALNTWRGSSIESLVITEETLMAKDFVGDEVYWEGFKKRNPKFKSVVIENSPVERLDVKTLYEAQEMIAQIVEELNRQLSEL